MAFFFLLLYITCIYMRPAEWIPFFYGWQLMDMLAIAAIVCLALTTLSSKKGFVKTPQNIFMLGFLLAIIASHLVHTYFGGAYTSFIDFSKTVIMYFLIVNIITSEKRFKVLINLIIIFTLILAIQGIIQHKTGFGLAGQPLSLEGRIRWVGIFNDSNDLALAFVIIVPILLGFVFAPPFIRRIIALLMLGVVLYAIYLTNSRGGTLALITVVFLYLVFSFKRKRHFFIGLIIGALLAGLLFKFGPSRMAMLTAEEESAYNRVDAWYEGLQMLKSNSLFGIGKGMFTNSYRLVAHNSFVHCFAETGLVGFFFWMALVYMSFKNLFAIQKEEFSSKASIGLKLYANSLIVSLFGFLAAAFFLSRTYIALPYLLFALSVALFNIAQKKVDSLENKFVFSDIRNVGLLCIGTLVVILCIVKMVL